MDEYLLAGATSGLRWEKVGGKAAQFFPSMTHLPSIVPTFTLFSVEYFSKRKYFVLFPCVKNAGYFGQIKK